MKKVLITDDVHPYLVEALKDRAYICDYRPKLSLDETRSIISHFHGVVINSKITADKSFISSAPKLEFIARLGSGLEIIDLEAARKLGVHVLSAPEGNCNAVAEQAVGMLLALMNNLLRADREVRDLQWNRENNRGRELRGMTMGIIGYGHTGPALAEKMSGFGVRVLAHDKYKVDLRSNQKHVEICDLKTIQNQADIISLHVSLNPSSFHMVNREFIEQCTRPIIIINTSRGQAVCLEDLLWGLREGKIAGACLDVFENEKPATFSEEEKALYSQLYLMENVVLSPHIAGWTVESKKRIAEVLIEKLDKANI